MKIGIIVLATGTYIRFIEPLYKSAENRLLKGHQLDWFILTDAIKPKELENVFYLPAKHYGWPEVMLKRYGQILEHCDLWKQYDYLLHLDADLQIVERIGDEILGDLVATESPIGFDQPAERKPFERDPESAAYVPMGVNQPYCTGSLILGKTERMLDLFDVCNRGLIADIAADITPRLHEESHLNRYLMDQPPTRVLDCGYCHPKGSYMKDHGITPKIWTLDKVESHGREYKT